MKREVIPAFVTEEKFSTFMAFGGAQLFFSAYSPITVSTTAIPDISLAFPIHKITTHSLDDQIGHL